MKIWPFSLIIFLTAQLATGQNICSNDSLFGCFFEEKFELNNLGIEIKSQVNDSFYGSISFALADLDLDCKAEVFGGSRRSKLIGYNVDRREQISKIETSIRRWDLNNPCNYVIGKVNGEIRIFFAVVWGSDNPLINGKVVCLDLDGAIVWISDADFNDALSRPRRNMGPTLGLADFNQDGIPEVYTNNRIFNAVSGKLLCTGFRNGVGVNWMVSNSVAADLDDNPNDLELAAGYTIYDVRITNIVDSAGNRMTPFNLEIDGEYFDGRTSVADINNDKKLDVVVNFGDGRRRNPFLYSYYLNVSTPELIAQVNWPGNSRSGERGASIPALGYVTDNSLMDIVIITENKLRCFEFDGSSQFDSIWSFDINEGSGATNPCLFDFNGDGILEVVVNQEYELSIVDGSTMTPLTQISHPCTSLTHFDNPVIGSIIADGEAEICVICSDTFQTYGSLTVFGSPDSLGPWAPAPPIWNQYAYHPLSINDDLTVPQFQKNKATYEGGRYNNFMAQRTLLDSNGMYKRRAASIYGEIDCINYDIESGEYTVTFSIYNKSDASLTVDSGMTVSFYNGDPQNGGVLIGHYNTDREMFAGDSLLGLSFTFTTGNLDALFMVVNTDGADFSTIDKDDFGILECDFFDNFSQSRDLPEILDLTDSICDGQDYTFLDTVVNQEGIYLRTLKDTSGCDSIVARLDLQTSDSIHIIERITRCDTYTWKGTTYRESGTFSETYNVPDGCDSTVTLELTINKSILDTIETTVCDSLMWQGDMIRQSGMYRYDGMTTEGCDSTLVLDLTVNQSTTATIQATTCQSFSWKGRQYDQSGNYTFDTLNILGCDSIITLELQIRDTIKTNEIIQICTGDTVLVFGQEVFEEGSYSGDFQTTEGCDSTHNIEVRVDDVFIGSRQVSFCAGDSVYVIDRWIKNEGTIEITKTNGADCDSLLEITAIQRPTTASYDTLMLCRGDTINVFNQKVTEEIDLEQLLTGGNGCDSTSYIRVNILEPTMTTMQFTLCPEDSIMIHGRWITGPETVTQRLQRDNGCDSLEIIEIIQLATPPPPTYNLNCETGEVEVTIDADDEWTIMWDNGSNTRKTTYPAGQTASVELTTAPDCELNYTVNLPDLPNIQTVPQFRDTLLSEGSTFVIDLNQDIDPNEWKVEWFPKDVVDCDTCMRVTIRSDRDVEIRVVFTHISGCELEQNFNVRYDEEGIFIPNVFTPNGDNINDFWKPFTTENVKVLRIWVYDRWGELVYFSEEGRPNTGSPTTGWDGFFNGERALEGVYVYLVDFELGAGDQVQRSGDLTLVR